jgi:hypothetical protein
MLTASLLSGVVTTLALAAPVQSGMGNCGVKGQCPSPTSVPPSSAVPTTAPSPTGAGYTFDDEFSGSVVSPVWRTDYHVPASVLVAYDPPTESGGDLHLPLRKLADGWHGASVDTKQSFLQAYGSFEARIAFPKGPGIWPAFWGYAGGPEIDGMEVCANPIGSNGGNDASLLHQTVHVSSTSSTGFPTRHGDLSGAFHTYRWTWTPTQIAFSLDGVPTATWAGSFATAMPVILDLAVGGAWCGAPTSGTPVSAEMLVDYVRVIQ